MIRQIFIIGCATFFLAFLAPDQNVSGQIKQAELVGFKSGDLELKGYLWKPLGDGPFPAVLWNHGSEKLPGTVDTVATYFVEKGYVFFVPHRRGQGRSPGPYIMDELNKAGREASAASCWLISTKSISEINWPDLSICRILVLWTRTGSRSWVFPSAGSKPCLLSSVDPDIASQ